ncbi:MAG: HAD family phosphatase [Thermoanaerobaculia bacterium]
MTQRPRNFPGKLEAAIFDFDETMVDLERQHTAAHERLCGARGVRYSDIPERLRTASGRRIIDDIREMHAFFRWHADILALLAERQRYFDEEIACADLQLMDGVERTVRDLHRRGLLLAIATSAVRGSIETILGRFDLLPLFAVIVDGTEVERGKPDPEAYLVTAGRLGVDPALCIVFEDSSVGVRSAKAAGMYCIGVRNPRAQQLQDLAPADLIVTTLSEVDSRWFVTSSSSSSSR